MDAVFLKRNKGRRLRAAPPIVRKFCCFQQEDLSGDLLHGEVLDNIACPVKPPVSREPFRSYQRGEMRFPRAEVLLRKTLVRRPRRRFEVYTMAKGRSVSCALSALCKIFLTSYRR